MAAPDRLLPRKQPNQDRARVTVDAIKEAAAQLLVERGYARASTNLIAKRAGVSVGSLYQYFPGKEAIFATLVDDHMVDMHNRADAALTILADVRVPFDQALRSLLEQMSAARITDNEDLLRVIEAELACIVPRESPHLGPDDLYVEQAVALLDARPDCAPRHCHAAALAIVAVCAAVTKWFVHQGSPGDSFDPYLDLAVAMCCEAAGYRSANTVGVGKT